MSRLGDHRVNGGFCEGSAKEVVRLDVKGRAVFAMGVLLARFDETMARGPSQVKCPECGKTVDVKSNGNIDIHFAPNQGWSCPGSGTRAPGWTD